MSVFPIITPVEKKGGGGGKKGCGRVLREITVIF